MAPNQGGMSEELLNLRFMQRARFKQRHEVVAICTDSRQTLENDKKTIRFRSYADEKRQLTQNFIDNFGLRWHDVLDAESQKDKMFGRMSFNGANPELENVMQLEMEDLGQQQPDKNAADWRKLGEEEKEGVSAAEYDVETPNDSTKTMEFYDPEEMTIKINDDDNDNATIPASDNAAKRRQQRFEKPKALNQVRPDRSSARGRRNYGNKHNGASTASFHPSNPRWQKPNFAQNQQSKNQSFRPQKKRTSHSNNKYPALAVKKFRADNE